MNLDYIIQQLVINNMKKTVYLFILLFITSATFANNLVIGNPSYNSGANTLTFTIKWDNSWRINGVSSPNNYDAVWVFVKRQPCAANGLWSHALLSTTSSDHSVTGSFNLVADAVTDGMGVFIHRDASANNQIGSLATTSSVTIKLSGTYNPALVGSSTNSDNFRVIGIEMVYVPQGSFYLGDGRSSNSSNFSAGNTIGAVQITSTTQANGIGAYNNYVSSPLYGCFIPLPSTYPTGFNGFYCMKYEINQQQIVDYLNTLNYDQQAARLAVWGARLPNVANTYFTNAANYRQMIKVATAGTSNTIPAVFGLDNAWNAYIAAGYLNWQDLTSYLDWSGLRPMTEFEYEKACRGTLNPVAYEFPWGTGVMNTSSGGMTNANTVNETMNMVMEGIVHFNWDGGPMRSGFAATSNSNRLQAAATFYGIMEMAGNVVEQCVGGGTGYNYSTFTTANGDGALTTKGLANVTGWPTDGGTSSGTILKGGGFYTNGGQTAQMMVSDRQFYGGDNRNLSNTRDRNIGGRGVRSY
jgi:formylglycine-generating enzyme required for sulfatase activity